MATNSKKTSTKTTPATPESAAKKTAAANVKKTPAKKVDPAAKATPITPPDATDTAPAAGVKKAAGKVSSKPAVSPEQRYRMIATAAYYMAEQRGFHGDYGMQDWIAAEAEIDAMLKTKA